MDIYTIYFNASDFPDQYCARRHSVLLRGPTPDHWSGPTLECARAWVREFSAGRGMMADICFPREEKDEPPVVESWI